MKSLILIEQTETGYSSYCPDLPGCISTGETLGAIEFHLEGLKLEGLEIQKLTTSSAYVEVSA